MSTKTIGIAVIVVVALVVLAWLFTDRRYSQTLPFDAQQAVTTPAAPGVTVNATDASGNAVSATNNPSSVKNLMHTVTIKTNKGTIVFETYDADAPKTVQNFVTLADKGFYNGTIFHRVIPGFMIQGGDPTGTGMGGPGYKFADELNAATPSYQAGYARGTVAMANSGPDTNGSQFFIMQADQALPHNYTIFGKVISGLDIVDAIANTPRNSSDKPLSTVTMTAVTVATTQ